MSARVTVKRWKLPSGIRWVVRYRRDGLICHNKFKTRKDAEIEAAILRGLNDEQREKWLNLSDADRVQKICAALDELPPAEVPAHKLPAVIDDLLDAKRKAGRSHDYVLGLGTVLKQFAAGRQEMDIAKIDAKQIESFLATKQLASRSTLRSRLATLFKYALLKKLVVANPCAELEAVTYVKPPPRILTPEQAEKCLRALAEPFKPSKHSPEVSYKHALAWFVLSCFCGLRPEEAEKTRRKNINLKEGWIKVDAQTTKVRERRVVYPRPEAMTLLRAALKKSNLPMKPQRRRRVIHHLRKAMGWDIYPRDITRHSAASYWLADTSVDDVSKALGNSAAVLLRDYKALVTREQSAAFWKLAATFRP